jgi:hypothetical protein
MSRNGVNEGRPVHQSNFPPRDRETGPVRAEPWRVNQAPAIDASCSLSVWSQWPSAQDLIDLIGVEPDFSWNRGRNITKSGRLSIDHPESCLCYCVPYEETLGLSLSEQVHQLLDWVDASGRLRALVDRPPDDPLFVTTSCLVLVFPGVSHDVRFALSAAALSRLATYRAVISVEVSVDSSRWRPDPQPGSDQMSRTVPNRRGS